MKKKIKQTRGLTGIATLKIRHKTCIQWTRTALFLELTQEIPVNSLTSQFRRHFLSYPRLYCEKGSQEQAGRNCIMRVISPSLDTQLWSDGCVAWGVYTFQDIAKVWS